MIKYALIKKRGGFSLLRVGEAGPGLIFRAGGGEMRKTGEDTAGHKHYDLVLAGEVVGRYISWCGRHPCYTNDEAVLRRLAAQMEPRLKGKVIIEGRETQWVIDQDLAAGLATGFEKLDDLEA